MNLTLQNSTLALQQLLLGLMAHSHCTGPGQGQGPGNDGFLYYAIYCSHYTGRGTGTGN